MQSLQRMMEGCKLRRCSPSKLVMIGDRYLTDVVYGNRHGMLTIRPTPLTLSGEPLAVRLVSPIFHPSHFGSVPRPLLELGRYRAGHSLSLACRRGGLKASL